MTPADLAKFCADEDEQRSYMRKLFTRDGFTWATNGHILVRVPALADVPEDKHSPDIVARTWEKVPAPGEWHPVPEVAMPAPIVCWWCVGDGKHPEDRRYKCENCDGDGYVPDTKSKHVIGRAHFADRYLALIQGWEIAPTWPYGPAWIRHEEAMGLLMPMRM